MFKYLLARVREARAGELEGESGLEAGFTLIELMVVLLIIAILLAIAIPTFLGVSGSARDRAAQSNLTNGVTDAAAYYQNGQTYDSISGNTGCSQVNTTGGNCTAAVTGGQSLDQAMAAQEPAFTWLPGTTNIVGASSSTCPKGVGNCVSVLPVDVAAANDGQGVVIAVLSGNSNTCWYAMNLQTTPASSGGAAATGFDPGATTLSESTAGTYYAKQTKATTCDASNALSFASTSWASSYSSAPDATAT